MKKKKKKKKEGKRKETETEREVIGKEGRKKGKMYII